MLRKFRCYVAVVIECENAALSEVNRTTLLRWNLPEMVVQLLRVKPLHVEDASRLVERVVNTTNRCFAVDPMSR
jgi:hypothetical protein